MPDPVHPDTAHPDSDFPADPYPGAVPPFSFVHLDGHSHPLTFDACWRVGDAELDLWLGAHDALPMSARIPLLSYGSNRNPGKITWLRQSLGLEGPVVVLRARTQGLAAVWASGVRARDGQRTSVLGAAPGASERHALWLATAEQVAVLDRCEGRGDRYRLARLGTGAVFVEEWHSAGGGSAAGVRVEAPWCYVGLSAIRRPLLVDGRPVRCADVPQAQALGLVGDPAPDDGLAAQTVHDAPDPDEWPAAVFVYGTLQPGQRAWSLMADHAAGAPWRATVAGRLGDTGLGYPALVAEGTARVPGWVVPVRDPAALLARLDAYEGSEYRRVRVEARGDGAPASEERTEPGSRPSGTEATGGGATACWTYVWAQAEELLTHVRNGWPY